jgi:hypothetical protein
MGIQNPIRVFKQLVAEMGSAMRRDEYKPELSSLLTLNSGFAPWARRSLRPTAVTANRHGGQGAVCVLGNPKGGRKSLTRLPTGTTPPASDLTATLKGT